jgi:hypothetical protein
MADTPHRARDATVSGVSFEEFFLRERTPMVRMATSLVDIPERAEEIVQDAFERTLLAWSRLDQPGAYLSRSVVNGCRSESCVDGAWPDATPHARRRLDCPRRTSTCSTRWLASPRNAASH